MKKTQGNAPRRSRCGSICAWFSPDAVKIAMGVTMVWARFGFYAAKSFELFFSAILTIPDRYLSISQLIPLDLKTTDGKKIEILSAKDADGDITNKVRLFLLKYWENADKSSAMDMNGFDFSKLSKILGTKLMFCSYVLSSDEDNLRNIQHIMADMDKKKSYVSRTTDLSDRTKMFANHFTFDEEKNLKDTLGDELADLLMDCKSLE